VRGTVGGTSFAAFLPGFFLGGRTQVLLNAPLEMTSGRFSANGEDEGGELLLVLISNRVEIRGARGATSEGLSA